MLTFLYLASSFYYILILTAGITLANILTRIIDYGIYRYAQRVYQQSLKTQADLIRSKILQEAEPGVALPAGVN